MLWIRLLLLSLILLYYFISFFIWLHWVLAVARGIFIAAGMWDLLLRRVGSTACGLSCPAACRILVPLPGIKPTSPCIGRQILNHWEVKRGKFLSYPSWLLFLRSLASSRLIRGKEEWDPRGFCRREIKLRSNEMGSGKKGCREKEYFLYVEYSAADKL